ncbi:MAG: head GIN domain-containing protein [Christiangramia sp.]
MKKILGLLMMIFILGCSSESAPDCLQTAGTIVSKETNVQSFSEIMVYERIKLFIEQGNEHKVIIESGENLINDVSAEVIDSRLILRNENSCNLFREYAITKVYVTTPNLTWLQTSTGWAIESIGTLKFPNLWLRSLNQERNPDIHTDGDFILDLDVKNLRITTDHISNFFLTGKVENFDGFFAAGDGRLEARDLIVQNYELFHRGTNKLIINPQQKLKADIYSYGDIISVNRPPEVDVKEHFKGKMIFEN